MWMKVVCMYGVRRMNKFGRVDEKLSSKRSEFRGSALVVA